MFFAFRSMYRSRAIIISGWINYALLLQQLAHWRLEFARVARCTFTATKSVLEDNPVVVWRNKREKETEREKTSSPVPPCSRHGRGTSKSTGAAPFLLRRRYEILCLPQNRVFFSPRPRNTQIMNGANVASIGTSIEETGIREHWHKII